MKKGQDIDFKALGGQIASFFQRFHTIVFFLILGVAVATALLLVILTLSDTGSTATVTSSDAVNGTFDEKTIQALRDQEKATNEPFELPPGRTDPFVE